MLDFPLPCEWLPEGIPPEMTMSEKNDSLDGMGQPFLSEPRLSSSKRHWRPTANEGSTEPVGKASLQSPCGPTWAHMPSKVTQAHSQYMSISNPQHPTLNYLDIYPLPESQGSHSLLSASLRFCDCWQAKRPIWLRRHDLQRIQTFWLRHVSLHIVEATLVTKRAVVASNWGLKSHGWESDLAWQIHHL